MGELVPGFIRPRNIPDGWEVLQIQDVATVVQGGRLGLSKADYIEIGIPAFSAAGQDGFVSEVEFSQPGVVLSSIGANCGRCFRADTHWTTLANTQAILPFQGRVDHRFLYFRLNDGSYWLRSGSAQPFIKPVGVKKSWISVPPLEEQQRIADILDTVDESIHTTKRVISKSNLMLKGLLYELIGRHSRVGKGWRQISVGELGSVVTGGTPPTADVHCWDGHIPFVTPGDIDVWGDIASTDRYVTQRGAMHAKQVPGGSVAVVCIGSIGKIGRIRETSITNQQINTVIPSSRFDSEFVAAVLELIRPDLEAAAGRQVVPIVNANMLRSLPINVCALNLQLEISDHLVATRNKICCERVALDKLQKLRAGLAADLLSGRVRTTAA